MPISEPAQTLIEIYFGQSPQTVSAPGLPYRIGITLGFSSLYGRSIPRRSSYGIYDSKPKLDSFKTDALWAYVRRCGWVGGALRACLGEAPGAQAKAMHVCGVCAVCFECFVTGSPAIDLAFSSALFVICQVPVRIAVQRCCHWAAVLRCRQIAKKRFTRLTNALRQRETNYN